MSKIYVCMADGLEEVECLAVVDILKRGGMEVEQASMTGNPLVIGSHNIRILADSLWNAEAALTCDGIFLPGGMPGTKHLSEHPELGNVLVKMLEDGKFVCAICAAPSVLGKYHILEGKKATCYPGWESALSGAEIVNAGVVRDGNVITGRGLGFAIDEGLEILKAMVDEETSEKIKKAIQHPTTI